MCLMFACLVMRHANCHASCSAAHTSTSKTMDSLGFEPRAPRMLSGCDTTTPRALAGMHDNGTFSRRAHSLCWPASARGRAKLSGHAQHVTHTSQQGHSALQSHRCCQRCVPQCDDLRPTLRFPNVGFREAQPRRFTAAQDAQLTATGSHAWAPAGLPAAKKLRCRAVGAQHLFSCAFRTTQWM